MPVVGISSRDNITGGPQLDEGEQILYTQPNVSLFFNTQVSEGSGTLFVTNKHATWLSSEDPNKGFSIDFPFISLHAISRDTTFFPHQCLYCQLDVEPEEDIEEEEEEGEDNAQQRTTLSNGTFLYSEARFVPVDPSTLGPLFDAFSQSASLNPDEIKDEEGDFFFNEEEVNQNLQHLDGVLQMPTPEEFQQQIESNQFDDAEEEGDDEMES